MPIELRKGERITLDSGLRNITVGLGWDPNEGSGDDYDLDASAFMIAKNGKIPEEKYFVYYNNMYSPDNAVEGAEDDLDGKGSDGGDDEEIKVNLGKVNQDIEEIVFVVTIHDYDVRKQNFGQVRNSYIRIVNTDTNEEIMKYELDEDYSTETAIEFARLYKRDAEWKFEAMGIGYEKGLQHFVDKYN